MKILNPSMIGDQNKIEILNLIKNSDGISRQDISRRLHLSPPAVSKNVSALIEAGIIREDGTDQAQMGRKPVLLQYNSGLMYVLGIELMPQGLRGAIADLRGDILGWRELPSCISQGASSVLDQLRLLTTQLLDLCPPGGRVAVATVATPALTRQQDKNDLIATFVPDWSNINVKTYLEEQFGITVVVMNDVELDLIGECWDGAGANFQDILFLKYGEGFAARALVNGKLLQGYNGAAGELGYCLPNIAMLPDRFSAPGVLEKEISRDIFVRYRKLDGNPAEESPPFRKIISLANQGDEAAAKVVWEIVDHIAVILNHTVLMLDPEIVILGGEASFFTEQHLQRIQEVLARTCPFLPKLAVAKLGRDSAVIGGIQTALTNAEAELVSYWKPTSIGKNSTETR